MNLCSVMVIECLYGDTPDLESYTMWLSLKDYISPAIALGAVIIAASSLKYTLRNARKNMRLSIQQAVIKIAIEKAKDCNTAWDKSNFFLMT